MNTMLLLVVSNLILAFGLVRLGARNFRITETSMLMITFITKLRERFPIEVASVEREMIENLKKFEEKSGKVQE